MNIARGVLRLFEDQDWGTSVKESTFTKPLTALMAALAEAETTGDKPALDKSKMYVHIITAGKTYMKRYREFLTARLRHDYFISLT